MQELSGVINVYKEQGYTSSDAVVIIRGILRRLTGAKIKAGHTGTLDPMAEGVLPVCIGKATKSADLLQSGEKEYTARIIFGIDTDTEDTTGAVINKNEIRPTEDMFIKAISSFFGVISQTPPMYSAVKINGKRLYKSARQGIQVERPPREVIIHNIELINFTADTAEIKVTCGKGVYIRTLIKDIGKAAGILACMDSLIRTRSGDFRIEDSLKIKDIEALAQKGLISQVLMPV